MNSGRSNSGENPWPRPRPGAIVGSAPDPFSLTEREPVREAEIPRLFVREPGWKAQIKHGSERMFCFLMAPGEGNYHRIADGELYLQRGDERICLPCADRHGLLHHEPKALRPSLRGIDLNAPHLDEPDGYGLRDEGVALGD